MRKITEKRGEISSSMIVTVIILLIGFGIIFYFLVKYQWTETIDRETCHESAVLRGSLPTGTENYVPLKCKTAKFCISVNDKGDCPEFIGEKYVTTVKVSNIEDINRFLAREMIDCWSTMGEGKLSLFNQFLAKNYGIGSVMSSCVLCSRIGWDKESLNNRKIDLKQINVLEYMKSYKMAGKDVTYFQYLAGEGGEVTIKDSFNVPDVKKDNKVVSNGEGGEMTVSPNNPEAEIGQGTVMFMQISAPSGWGVLKNVATAVGFTYGTSFILAPKTMLKAITSKWTLIVAGAFTAYAAANTYFNQQIAAGYCSDLYSPNGEKTEGCSVVRLVNYNVNDISQYCNVIESIP